MNSLLRFLAATALSGVALGVVFTSCTPQTITLGFQGPLTGTTADLGVQGRNGALLAVETINSTGGAQGRPLHLDPRDDRNDQEVARNLVEEFRQDGVEVVIGPMTSVAGVAVAELIADTGPVYVSPTVSTVRVSGRDDFFFRLEGATDQQATALGEFAASRTVERVVVLADTGNSEYSVPYRDAFIEGFQAGGGVVVRVMDLPLAGMMRWNSMVATITEEQPDAVLVIASAVDTARFAQAVRSAERDWTLLASGWAATPTLFTLGGSAVEDVFLARTSYATLTDTKEGTDFRNRFFRRFGKIPSFAASQAYDAVFLVVQALDRSRPVASAVREQLSAVGSFNTLLGPVAFDQFGDIEPSVTIVRAQDGEFVPAAELRGRAEAQ